MEKINNMMEALDKVGRNVNNLLPSQSRSELLILMSPLHRNELAENLHKNPNLRYDWDHTRFKFMGIKIVFTQRVDQFAVKLVREIVELKYEPYEKKTKDI